MSTITMRLEIANVYGDEEIITHETVELPVPEADEDLDDWGEDHIFPLTGTGRTEGDAAYFVEVLESSDPTMVGHKWEWC